MNKKEFRESFIKPLEKALKMRVFWNGKDSEEVGLGKIKNSNTRGVCYSGLKYTPIILKYRPNEIEMLSTLVHEFAHGLLHYSCNLEKAIKEIEAETVAKIVLDMLGHKCKKNREYIDGYQHEYFLNHGREYNFNKRKNKITEVVTNIYDILKNTNYNDIKDKSKYKYKVICNCCGLETFYQKKATIIKTGGKHFMCNNCRKAEDFTIIEL